jgi:deazaflavin-dependent oxidoreductase (nitroreductase family)
MMIMGVLLLGLVMPVIVLVVAMRTKNPWVLGVVRRFNRAFFNPIQMRSADTPGAYAAIVRHHGRVSGRVYQTPVRVEVTDGTFVIALPYGTQADWLRNVLASGSAEIVHDGRAHHVGEPEVVPLETAADAFSADELRTLRAFGVDECLRVRHVDTTDVAGA